MSSIVVKKRNLRSVLKNENKNLAKKPKLCVDESGNIISSYESILENLKVLFPSFSMSDLKSELEENKNDISSIMDTLQQKKNLKNNAKRLQNLSLIKQEECSKLPNENFKETDSLNNQALLEEAVNYLPNCQNIKEVKIVVKQFKKRLEENIEMINKDEKKKLNAEIFILKKALQIQNCKILNEKKKIKDVIYNLQTAKYSNYILENKLKQYEFSQIKLENPNNIF